MNGGTLYSPTLLKHEIPPVGKRVIKQSTSDTMRKLLRLVWTEGSTIDKRIEGYMLGGKTGTAEKTGGDHYEKSRLLSSYVGSFPMNDPRYIVMAVMDEPKGIKETYGFATGGWTSSPVVRKVIQEMAPMMGIKPVDEQSPKILDAMYIDYGQEVKRVASN